MKISRIAILGLLSLAPIASLSYAQPASERAAVMPLPQQLDRLLDHGQYDEARALLRSTLANTPDAALHYAHFEGLILTRQGRYEEAVAMFRSILAMAPNFTPSRIELAKTLYRTGQTDAANHHFEAISLGQDDVGLKRLAETYIAQIKSAKPYGFSGYFAVLPSTNANRGTDALYFDSALGRWQVNPQSRRQTGVGLSAGGNAFRRWEFNPDTALLLTGGFDVRKYSSLTALDQLTLSGTALLLRDFGTVSARIGPSAEYTLTAWAPYVTRYGLVGGLTFPVGQRTLIDVSLSALRQDYVTGLDYRDGWQFGGTVTARHMFSPSLTLSVTAGFIPSAQRWRTLTMMTTRQASRSARSGRAGFLLPALPAMSATNIAAISL